MALQANDLKTSTDLIRAYIVGDHWQHISVFPIKPHPEKSGRPWASKFAGICPITGNPFAAGAKVRWYLNVDTQEAVVMPEESSRALSMRFYSGEERSELDGCLCSSWKIGGVAQIAYEMMSYSKVLESVELLHSNGKTRRWLVDMEVSRKAAERSIKKSALVAYELNFKPDYLSEKYKEGLQARLAQEKKG